MASNPICSWVKAFQNFTIHIPNSYYVSKVYCGYMKMGDPKAGQDSNPCLVVRARRERYGGNGGIQCTLLGSGVLKKANHAKLFLHGRPTKQQSFDWPL